MLFLFSSLTVLFSFCALFFNLSYKTYIKGSKIPTSNSSATSRQLEEELKIVTMDMPMVQLKLTMMERMKRLISVYVPVVLAVFG